MATTATCITSSCWKKSWPKFSSRLLKLLVHGGTLRLAARKSVSFREVNYDCTSLARLDSATRCGRLRAIVERNGAALPENHKGLSRRIRFSQRWDAGGRIRGGEFICFAGGGAPIRGGEL